MSSSNPGPQIGTRGSHDSYPQDQQPGLRNRDWPLPKSQVSSTIKTRHRDQKQGQSGKRLLNAKGQVYQNGTVEYGDGGSHNEVKVTPLSPPQLPNGALLASGSGMDPGHELGLVSGHSFEYYTNIGMGSNARMGNGVYHQMPRYYYENQSSGMGMVGGVNGPRPLMQCPSPLDPIVTSTAQYRRSPSGSAATSPPSATQYNSGEFKHMKKWAGLTESFTERPHPSHSDYPTAVPHDKAQKWEDLRRESDSSKRRHEPSGLTQISPPTTHLQSEGELPCGPTNERREKKKMILLRGLPGSGKTTLAK